MAVADSSRFAVACALLRQCMREHQRQEQMGLTGAFGQPMATVQTEMAEKADARTMQLFPTPSNGCERRDARRGAQRLTIFYQGRVLEFEGFPADKVKELMVFAASTVSSPVPENEAHTLLETPATAEPSTELDLPITRKASLQRFLQKRKHRTTTEFYHKGLASQPPPLEKDVTTAGKKPKDDPATTNWLRL